MTLTDNKATVYETKDGAVAVRSPYNPDFVNAAKANGARWDKDNKVWRFFDKDAAEVVELAERFYSEVAVEETVLPSTPKCFIQPFGQGSGAFVQCPYNEKFIELAKKLKGEWDPGLRRWFFAAADGATMDRVIAAAREAFGDAVSVPDDELLKAIARAEAAAET